ncbi:MAG: aryl-sulfate sulfotransferase N-terminal domain-containing protein [Draconibacterium sp.]|nr:aryl-sulfate sulfotransferase N-terminal domain-containing protein [Draconibacterium sp.]
MKIQQLLFLGIIIFFVSCNSKIEFSKEPVVVENSNKSTPLTCFVDFETTSSYEKVTFHVSDSERNFQLEYSSEEKIEHGYLILLMRPDQENKIKVEITDTKGKKHLLENELVFKTPALPEGEAEFPKIAITKVKSEKEKDELILFNPRRRSSRRAFSGQN